MGKFSHYSIQGKSNNWQTFQMPPVSPSQLTNVSLELLTMNSAIAASVHVLVRRRVFDQAVLILSATREM